MNNLVKLLENSLSLQKKPTAVAKNALKKMFSTCKFMWIKLQQSDIKWKIEACSAQSKRAL